VVSIWKKQTNLKLKDMKRISIYITSVLIVLSVLISCKGEPSLQKYYVEHQDSDNFVSLDLPASLLNLGDNVSNETKETMQSIKKMNVLAFKLNDNNKEVFLSELKKVKSIIKNDSYSELIRVKHKKANIIVKFLGKEDAVKEFIVFASDNSKGFALARVLGNQMDPEKILKMTKDLENMNADDKAFSQIKGLLGEFEGK